MTIANQLAKHLRDVHFGGNWSVADLKTTLSDVPLEDATAQVYSLNSIAAITYHMVYYLDTIITVLEEHKLVGTDELSWVTPIIASQEEWETLLQGAWEKAERAAQLIEKLPDDVLTKDFVDPRYGTNFRNIAGIIEHMHYHLGQIVLIKKLLPRENT